MTPAERARLVEKEEFEAECRAVRQRALRHARRKRQSEAARISRWLAKEQPEASSLRKLQPRQKPKLYTCNGVSKTLSQWACECDVPLKTLSNRIGSGMPIERALTMKPRERAEVHTVDGVSKTLAGWARHIGITYEAMIGRLRKGRSLAEAIAMPARSWRGRGEGVGRDLRRGVGTGEGSVAQERAQIEFSDQPESSEP